MEYLHFVIVIISLFNRLLSPRDIEGTFTDFEASRHLSTKHGNNSFLLLNIMHGSCLILGGKNLWISDFCRKIGLNFGEDLFFFGDHLILSGKNLPISEHSEKFRLNFRTIRVKLIQEQWKFGSRSFALFLLFQNNSPLFQILATRLPVSNLFSDLTTSLWQNVVIWSKILSKTESSHVQ